MMVMEKPSRTALKVALNIIALGSKPGMEKILPPGIVSATKDLLVASGAASATAVRWTHTQKMVSVYEAFDWILPGQFVAFGHRKSFFERQVREGIEAGASQVLVLGAGYDTLCWRLASEFAGSVSFFEIDHLATAAYKARGIKAMGDHDNLYLLAEDLGERKLADVLGSSESWDNTASTVIAAEGLVMYLSPDAVSDLFKQCGAVTGNNSRFAFSYIPLGRNGKPDVGSWSGLMLWLQSISGEPWLWSIRPEDMETFLQRTGWLVDQDQDYAHRKWGVEYFTVARK